MYIVINDEIVVYNTRASWRIQFVPRVHWQKFSFLSFVYLQQWRHLVYFIYSGVWFFSLLLWIRQRTIDAFDYSMWLSSYCCMLVLCNKLVEILLIDFEWVFFHWMFSYVHNTLATSFVHRFSMLKICIRKHEKCSQFRQIVRLHLFCMDRKIWITINSPIAE